jgi:3-oxoacyl-[acyl-carrier-protein] synthase-3
MDAQLQAIAWHVPETPLTNERLAQDYPDWPVEKIEGKTGIVCRFVAGALECASDLAQRAAEKLVESGAARPADIDFVLFCTQSPDYFLPTTACVLQHRLGIPTSAGALDFNLGCSGFVYGLGLAAGLIETGQARNVLLLTAETYSKFIRKDDRSVRTLFGDGAAATLIRGVPSRGNAAKPLGPFVYGTDGAGAENLIVRAGAFRPVEPTPAGRDPRALYMNGPEIFSFTLRTVPRSLQQLLDRAGLAAEDVDQFVFHQANGYMLEHLRQKCQLPAEKFFVGMRECGNTVSASIPIALSQAAALGRIKPGDRVAVLGFGVGYSWAGAMLTWSASRNE